MVYMYRSWTVRTIDNVHLMWQDNPVGSAEILDACMLKMDGEETQDASQGETTPINPAAPDRAGGDLERGHSGRKGSEKKVVQPHLYNSACNDRLGPPEPHIHRTMPCNCSCVWSRRMSRLMSSQRRCTIQQHTVDNSRPPMVRFDHLSPCDCFDAATPDVLHNCGVEMPSGL